MTSDAAGPDRPMVAPEGLRFSGVLQDGTEQGQPGGAQTRLRGRSSTNPLVNGSFGSFDFAELLKAPPSAGELTIQDLLAANPDWADQAVVSAGEAERNLNGGAEVGPDGTSPLLRWTSDGSMMEELLKTFTPGTPTFQGGAASNPFHSAGPFSTLTKHPSFSTALMKDPSLSSAVFSALLSQNSEDPLSMLAALPSLNPVGSSAPETPPPSGQQLQGSESLDAAEMQVPGQGYGGSAGAPLQERNPSLTFPTGLPGSHIGRPNSASDAGPIRGPSPAGLPPGQAHPQLSEGVLAMSAELPRFSDDLRYNMRPAQHLSEQAQNGPSQQGQAFVLGSRVVSLPPQIGRPGSAPVVRYGVDGPRVLFDSQREVPGGSSALHGDGRAQSLPNDFSRQAGGALHILDEPPTTSGRPSEAAYQTQQHRQEHYGGLASNYAYPVQSALPNQGSAIVQTPQQLGPRAGLPPIGGTRVQASVQAQRMARTGATTAPLPVSSRSGLSAQAQPSRPELQMPRPVAQPLTSAAAGPASSMLPSPPILLRTNGVPGNLQAQPASAALLSGQPGLPQPPLMPSTTSQVQPLPSSSAGGLSLSERSQGATQVPGLSSAPDGAAGTSAPMRADIRTAAAGAARRPSSFLSGLMTGIQPVVSSTVSPGTTSSVAMPQVAYVKPLPPLPSVPTIAEHYGALGPPRLPLASAGQGASYPPAHPPSALEVLPLVGTATLPQIPPLNLTSQPLLATRPAAGTEGLTFPMLPLPSVSITSRGLPTPAMPSYPGQRVTSASMARPASAASGAPTPAGGPALQQKGNVARYITVPGTQGVPRAPTIFTKPTAAPAVPKANGMRAPVAAGSSLPGGAYSTSEATSSGSGGKTKRERGGQPAASLAKRSAVSSGSLDGRPPQQPQNVEDDEGVSMDDANDDSMERSLRRAIRKEKNRASAAASRARREAYTASLEDQVKRLKANQEWLQMQLQQQSGDVDMTQVIPNRPKRQLSL